ncbi:MAG: UDP-N-acetylglucosamine 2-epimerase (non-hydrolyzing) [Clostridiales bacterium]|jgi:UDP-N-acetylglucosamine 2-epimerase (non-hydrolysing)|nr:UDP-N-acetylglucosamine 2-epimerase (non-hydrolyzing) [Clostridiales bacterium]
MGNKIKIITIFGTRPEAIKLAPVIMEMKKFSEIIDSIVLITSQHDQMLKMELKLFDLTYKYDLGVMREKQSFEEILTSSIVNIGKIILQEKPHMILVQGDTLTAFAGCLSAFFNKIKIGHVEAGLRTFDIQNPFPEEANRRLISVLSNIHFAPTEQNKINLINEGIKEKNIYLTGNTVIDLLKITAKNNYVFKNSILRDIDYKGKRIILLTAHRRENWGESLKNICKAVKRIVGKFEDVEVVFPVHLNPIVRNTVYAILDKIKRIHLIDPIDSEEMQNVLYRCYFVMTDSGGIQEEAPFFGKPLLVLRNETERNEGVQIGVAKICGVMENEIFRCAYSLLANKNEYKRMSRASSPYGDSGASEKIVKVIMNYFDRAEFNK